MKQHLFLLHGAIGSADQLQPLAEALEDKYTIHLLNFPGHAGTIMPETFSIEAFAHYIDDYCGIKELEQVHIFGYSMGGYVGMYLAKHHSSLVGKVATLATKFWWNEDIAAKEINMLQPDVIEQKLPKFATALQQRHVPNDWKELVKKTAGMLQELGKNNVLKEEDFRTIQTPSLILLGDRDKMVSIDETLAIYQSLPEAQLAILPETPHPIEAADVSLLAVVLKKFFG